MPFEDLDPVAAEAGFSGVVRVDRADGLVLERPYGLAHRGCEIPNDVGTRFGIASGTKGLTALTVVRLAEAGRLELASTVREFLGRDLPLVDDDVTIEHLLAHRSGIGDYLDEETLESVDRYVLAVPVHELATTEQYLAVLEGHPRKFAAGERFAYSNSAYVLLALIAERVSGVPFHELVLQQVCEPAGMDDTEFFRSDELPELVATGYVENGNAWRTNVFHLPVRGSGDGGLYTTAADVRSFWTALFAKRIVAAEWLDEMLRPRSELPDGTRRYGLGFWLHPSRGFVWLEGGDAGVSFRSLHDPGADVTCTLLSNRATGSRYVWDYVASELAL